jgi:hypothetical protein
VPASGGAGGYESNPFKLFGPSWNAIKLVIWPLILVYVSIAVASALPVLGVTTLAGFERHGYSASSAMIGLAIIGILMLAVIWYFFRALGASVALVLAGAKGEKIGFGESFRRAKGKGFKLFLFSVIFGFAVTFGLLLLIVPGMIVLSWYIMTPYVMFEENLGVFAAMSRSKQLSSGRFWDVFGVIGASSVLGIPSLIPVLGAIVSFILGVAYSAAPALRYLSLKEYKDQGKPFPAVSKANYVLPIVWAVTIVLSFVLVSMSALNERSSGTLNTSGSDSFSTGSSSSTDSGSLDDSTDTNSQ